MRFHYNGEHTGGEVKKRIHPMAMATAMSHDDWLNLEDVEVELTSEDPDRPIEGALLPGRSTGWRAEGAGAQAIRLTWPEPVRLRRIRLAFEELSHPRTQEFLLRANTVFGERDIVRQQFTFAPPGTIVEQEEYAANLEGVTRLELLITPAIDGREAVATLKEWRVA